MWVGVTIVKASEVVRTKLNVNGRVVIPASIRQALGLQAGEEILLFVENDELRMTSAKKRAERAQRLYKKYIGEGVSLVDELIADRRKEAAAGE
jgi:AbrB family looped-hinge helix DNA binding protein